MDDLGVGLQAVSGHSIRDRVELTNDAAGLVHHLVLVQLVDVDLHPRPPPAAIMALDSGHRTGAIVAHTQACMLMHACSPSLVCTPTSYGCNHPFVNQSDSIK